MIHSLLWKMAHLALCLQPPDMLWHLGPFFERIKAIWSQVMKLEERLPPREGEDEGEDALCDITEG